jgi:hypothetical protein
MCKKQIIIFVFELKAEENLIDTPAIILNENHYHIIKEILNLLSKASAKRTS